MKLFKTFLYLWILGFMNPPLYAIETIEISGGGYQANQYRSDAL